ncbi:Cna protein B-type domain-containing protein [Bifidobacterium dolichotidis]|uniref:Cna protein B-type domain-containing protein n=1 Tax=Bifidobacterium dolichotidis TaxID=2306976 RepID=A0A430FQF8_9BIFI|nr:Cna B-type domain-containing protein [Bifidobacterium dolichotidis]RSX55060.1 Cna protein B-type domain-containing protein [Bifidobacterium dolichotidis]
MTKANVARRARLVLAAMMSAVFACSGLVAGSAQADIDYDHLPATMSIPPEEYGNSVSVGTNSITVTYEYDVDGDPSTPDAPVPGAEFYLYQVADWDGKSTPMQEHLTLTPMYQWYEKEKDINITGQLNPTFTEEDKEEGCLSSMDATYACVSKYWANLNSTLFQTMKANTEFYPDSQKTEIERRNALYAVTDKHGQARFEGIGDGVYFVVSPIFANPMMVYSAQLVSLPNELPAKEKEHNIEIKAKPEAWKGDDPIHVKKVWKNDNAQTRPRSITVQLFLNLRDDNRNMLQLIDEVELNEDNDWEYTWSKLPDYQDFTVTEANVPDGYKVSVVEEGDGPNTKYFTLTNSKPGTPPKPTPTPTPTPAPSHSSERPAQTGANVAIIALVAVAACVLAVLLIIESRRVAKSKQ